MKRTKLETAKALAIAHLGVEEKLRKVFLLNSVNEASPDEPIKLLEVVEGTIERGIEPIAFTADPKHGIDYPSLIVEISPNEYQQILDKKLGFGAYPWTLGDDLLAA
jgi:hypothetical protein